MPRFSNAVRVSAIAILIASGSPLISSDLTTDVAFAKSDKAKDKGSNGKGRDKAKERKSSSSSKSSNASSNRGSGKGNRTLLDLFKKPQTKSTVVRSAPQPKAKPVKKQPAPKPVKKAPVAAAAVTSEIAEESVVEDAEKKNINSALGALNAANASETALQNASPNSRVGRIAAYRNQVLENEALREDLAEAEALLEGRNVPELTAEDYAVLLGQEAERLSAIELEIAEIQTALNAVGGINEELETDLEQAKTALVAQTGLISDLETQSDEATDYWTAAKLVEEKEATLAAQDVEASELLAAAANKPITDDVIEEVHRLLGLPEPEPEVQEGTDVSELNAN